MSARAKSSLVFSTVLFILAIGTALAAEKQTTARLQSELAKAPAKDAARVNPFAEQPAAIAAGEKLYDRYCSECHSESGKGQRRGPDLNTPEIYQAPAGALAWYLKNGNLGTGMPSWSKLPEPQRWQIVAFLQSKAK